jgi:PII-like signaling protein
MEGSKNSIMKIYASSTDKFGQKLLYEHIVYLAKEKGINGATVYRGVMGYGSSSKHVSSSKFWELTEKLPIVIEIIDSTEKIEAFYRLIEPELLKMPKGCVVSIDPTNIVLQKTGKKDL